MIRPTHSTAHPQKHSVEAILDDRSTEQALPQSSRVYLGSRVATGFFSCLSDAEYAVTSLRSTGFPVSQIVLVANHFRRQDQFGGVDLRDRVDSRCFSFSEKRVQSYNHRIAKGDYLFVIWGTSDQLRQAEVILKCAPIDEFGIDR
ncbi:MAG TPA: hypothetical protein V6D10_06975 [Trichocoleus sp.]|jgi:hypothetical protein